MVPRTARLSAANHASIPALLAAAYAEAGRLAEAVETGTRAGRLAAQQGKPELSAEIKARLMLYGRKTAYRDGANGDFE